MIKKTMLAMTYLALVACTGTTANLNDKELAAISEARPGGVNSAIAESVIQAAIDDANAECSDVLGSKSRLAENRSRKSLWISLGGLVAGSVVTPALVSANAAANAPWIAAFSGMGGAANMATRSIDEAGFSGAADARIMNDLSSKVKEQMVIASTETFGPDVRYKAAKTAKMECLYYVRPVYALPPDPKPVAK